MQLKLDAIGNATDDSGEFIGTITQEPDGWRVVVAQRWSDVRPSPFVSGTFTSQVEALEELESWCPEKGNNIVDGERLSASTAQFARWF